MAENTGNYRLLLTENNVGLHEISKQVGDVDKFYGTVVCNLQTIWNLVYKIFFKV